VPRDPSSTDPAATARQAFSRLNRRLARRGDGPDWADPNALNALWLTLPSDGSDAPCLYAAVRDSVPISSLPSRWTLPGIAGALRVIGVRAPRARAQAAPELSPRARPALVGSATALVRAQASGRSYLLTCAHVAVPDLHQGYGSEIDLTHTSVSTRCSVVDWRPAPLAGPEHSTIDAAVLSLEADALSALRTDACLLPEGVGARPQPEQIVSMRSRRGNFSGRLKVYWSGPVDLPGVTPGVDDYFIDSAIGYCCDSVGGDSGAAVWDVQNRLMGMHLAGLDGVGAGEPNAIYGPIAPVLDTFRVQPWLTRNRVAQVDTPTPAAASTRTGAAPTVSSTALTDAEVVACTLWGEARNQGERGLRAVASVIGNRWHTRYRRCTTAREVCLDRYQFSCWLQNDPNLPRMVAAARQPDAVFRQCMAIADELLKGTMADITRGARHYYAATMRSAPSWARGHSPCVVIGDHLFFNDVD